MTKQLPSGALQERRLRGPSLQAVLVAFISLVILFLWLNFVLTQEIESMGREIQVKSEELRALERQNDALLREISLAGSERNLARRAESMGYGPDMPIYLNIDEPIIGPTNNASETEDFFASLTAEEQWVGQSDPLWDLLGRQSGWSGEDPVP
jgi:hypothetical protein